MSDLSVLLVEDNRDDQELAIWALNKIGLNNISVASDGLEAFTMLYGDKDAGIGPTLRPDIIILDLRLPRIDGLDVLRRIRSDEVTREITVYALTSSEDPYDRQVCNELGVPSFFSKPLTVNAVLNLKLF